MISVFYFPIIIFHIIRDYIYPPITARASEDNRGVNGWQKGIEKVGGEKSGGGKEESGGVEEDDAEEAVEVENEEITYLLQQNPDRLV